MGDPNDPNNLHHGNDPSDRLYEITRWKADLTSDDYVDFSDLDAFITALTDSVGFAAAYPGLLGSMVFHSDLDCDGDLDFDDINPFVARLACDPMYLSPNCGACGGDLMSAQQLATGMRAHIPPARWPGLRQFVRAVIAYQQQPERREYWRQVLAHLGQ